MHFDNKIKKALGKGKQTSSLKIPKFRMPGNIGKIISNKKIPGASVAKQKQWANMPKLKKDLFRNTLSDYDGDRVPDKFDCKPTNTMRQHLFRRQGVLKVSPKKKEIYYKNPKGVRIKYNVSSTKQAKSYPSIDEVAYVLDNSPAEMSPEKTTIEFTSLSDKRIKKYADKSTGGLHSFTPRDGKSIIFMFPKVTSKEIVDERIKKSRSYRMASPERKKEILKEGNDRYFKENKESKAVLEHLDKHPQEKFKHDIIHEHGHAVGYLQDLNKEWAQQFDEEDSVSNYGKTKPEEDLAESYTYWLSSLPEHRIRNLDKFEKRRKFFERNLKFQDPKTTKTLREEFEEDVSPANLIREAVDEDFENYRDTMGEYYNRDELLEEARKKQHSAREEREAEFKEMSSEERAIERDIDVDMQDLRDDILEGELD